MLEPIEFEACLEYFQPLFVRTINNETFYQGKFWTLHNRNLTTKGGKNNNLEFFAISCNDEAEITAYCTLIIYKKYPIFIDKENFVLNQLNGALCFKDLIDCKKAIELQNATQ